jgi:cation diffusion facilitator family transporter
MGTHVAAFLITAIAYLVARRYRGDPRFSFGTGKVEVLGGYTSAIVLGVVAAGMAAESVLRMFHPLPIHYTESIAIGTVGLCVNVTSALLLGHGYGPAGAHSHGQHHPGHDDLNLRSAYVHVLADAVTSILAIAALSAGKFLGWAWLDPVMGIVGSAVVGQWAWGLLRDTSVILLDRMPATDLEDEIRKAVEAEGEATITDLHVWQLAAGQFSAIVSLVAREPRSPDHYRELLRQHEELRHLTVEIRKGT